MSLGQLTQLERTHNINIPTIGTTNSSTSSLYREKHQWWWHHKLVCSLSKLKHVSSKLISTSTQLLMWARKSREQSNMLIEIIFVSIMSLWGLKVCLPKANTLVCISWTFLIFLKIASKASPQNIFLDIRIEHQAFQNSCSTKPNNTAIYKIAKANTYSI